MGVSARTISCTAQCMGVIARAVSRAAQRVAVSAIAVGREVVAVIACGLSTFVTSICSRLR